MPLPSERTYNDDLTDFVRAYASAARDAHVHESYQRAEAASAARDRMRLLRNWFRMILDRELRLRHRGLTVDGLTDEDASRILTSLVGRLWVKSDGAVSVDHALRLITCHVNGDHVSLGVPGSGDYHSLGVQVQELSPVPPNGADDIHDD